MDTKQLKKKPKSKYVSTYIMPHIREEFDENLQWVMSETNRSKNEVCREILVQCLRKLRQNGEVRKKHQVELNLSRTL